MYLLLATMVAGWATMAPACPFCTALPNTLSDDLAESTAAVVARCEAMSAETFGIRMCRMRITNVLKGDASLANTTVEVGSTEELSSSAVFLLLGFGQEPLQWAPPAVMSTDGIAYLRGFSRLPDAGPERLEYFLRFLQHPDELVATDAYNEFAVASLPDIAALKDKLDRRWVVSQLHDLSVPLHRRRLCWTLLSQCGTAADTSLFDQSLRKREVDPTYRPGMNAAIACYLSLGGEQALTRIERDYLANPDAEYLDCFAAIGAIRVHGTELDLFPRQRLAQALRHVLAQPELADLVIPDLARWEDWSAIDRVVELFEISTEETSFLRPTAVRYLKTCPLPAGKEALERLRAIDPKAVQAAESSMMLYSGVASLPVPPPDSGDSADETAGASSPTVNKGREPRVAAEKSGAR